MTPDSNSSDMARRPLGASFRDPSGFLFTSGGVLYRQVNQSYRENYTHLMDSGLYKDLLDTELLIPHQEVSIEKLGEIPEPERVYKIIQPEKIEFISYPYEWCFSQLKDAALATMKIQKRALKFGMSLKDSSAYNIQYHHGRPVLIDTLSFEIYQEGKPWIAYRQFCQHFLAPLSLMAYRDVRLGQLLRVHIDGLPLDLTSKLLPLRTRLRFPLLFHIHLHAATQKRYSSKSIKTTRQVSLNAHLGLIDSLESFIRGLRWSSTGTQWGDYYDEHNYTPAGMRHKEHLVGQLLESLQPNNVWDLGANTGRFSLIASKKGIPTLAFDMDPGAVEQNYLSCIAQGDTEQLPLVLDLTNPSPSIGWHNQERLSFIERAPADAVLALALLHHLTISNNLPFDRLAAFFHQIGSWLVIEFIPKTDPQVQRLLASREDIFPDYNTDTFERVFTDKFIIHKVEVIEDSDRRLYLMEGR